MCYIIDFDIDFDIDFLSFDDFKISCGDNSLYYLKITKYHELFS